ncbi:recombinase family protein, partial [Kingella kingae]|uniref:recombinase family protein n=1 Tax=Kingella kingae TaxID=504 RepID=UPI00254ABF52
MKNVARIYCRVSTYDQDLSRQLELRKWAEERGFYVAKVYAEKASGRTIDRPKLNEMLDDLQARETVIAENIDRLSRLPIKEAELLIQQIKDKGARLLLPNVLDVSARYDPES